MQPAIIYSDFEKIRFFFLLAAVVSIGALLKKKLPGPWEKIALKKYVLIMFVAYILSEAQYLYIRGTFETFDYWTKKILIFYCISVYIDTPKKLKMAIWSVVLACSALTYYGYQYLLTDPTLSQFEGRLQSVGYYDLSNSYALILTVTWPLAFILFEMEKSIFKKLFLLLNLGVFCYFCFLTKSRGGILGISLAICLSVFLSKKIAKYKVIKLIFIGGAILLTATVGFSQIAERNVEVLGGDYSATNRIMVWRAAFRMLMAHPLLGIGWGHFTDEVKNYGSDTSMLAHNTIISVFAELGLLGGITLLLILKYCLTQLYKVMKQNSCEINTMAQGLFISLVAFLLNTSFSVKDHDPSYWMIISLTASCIKIFIRMQHEIKIPQPN